jgi:hypothetical protein
VVEPRDTHAQLARELLDAQGLVELVTGALHRSGNAVGVAPRSAR